jgi:hypothetical protein
MWQLLLKCIPFLLIVLFWAEYSDAKTRWSTFHYIPDADLLEGGSLLWDANVYYLLNNSTDSSSKSSSKAKPGGTLTLGIIEWVNVSAGYAGGPTLGMKMRLLGETRDWMPSVALGVRNIFSCQDGYYFGNEGDSISNEIYLAFEKGIENLRLRLNLGVMSVPKDKNDKFNFFFGAEKYFGKGLYLTFELFRRQKTIVPSLFVDWRFLKKKMELYGGVVDISGLASRDKLSHSFVQPGVHAGIRFLVTIRRGKSDGFTTLEDRLVRQEQIIKSLQGDLDSLKKSLTKGTRRIDGLSESVKELLSDSTSEAQRFNAITREKLAGLKTLYEQEPFEPDLIKKAVQELVIHREKILPVLVEVAVDKKEDNRIRTLATGICGEINNSAAADALIDILSQTSIPEIKIEALIALGKLKDIRAAFLIQQLSLDPNDAVAFTAAEVLQKLEKETGVPLTYVKKTGAPDNSIPENRIGVREPGAKGLSDVLDETATIESETRLQKVEPKSFSESIIKQSPAQQISQPDTGKKTTSSYIQIESSDSTDNPNESEADKMPESKAGDTKAVKDSTKSDAKVENVVKASPDKKKVDSKASGKQEKTKKVKPSSTKKEVAGPW